MFAKQNLERRTRADLDMIIEEERRAIAHELVQFEASASELASTMNYLIRHPLRSIRQVIGPARIAGAVTANRPFQTVGCAALAGLGTGLLFFQSGNAVKGKLSPAAPSQTSNFAQSIGGIFKSELTRLALVSLSHFLGQARESLGKESPPNSTSG